MKLKSLLAIVAPLAVLLSSCLKAHNNLDVFDDKGSMVSEISDVSYYGDVKVISLEASPATENVDILTLKFYAPRSNKPSGDVTMHLVRNDGLATAQGFTAAPANGIVVPSLDIVIPKATGEATLTVTINKNNLNLSNTYGLGFVIGSVSSGVISELGKQIVVAFIIKNAYDADYLVNGYFFHPSAGRDIIDLVKHLSTQGAARCQAPLGDLGSSGYYFQFDVSGTNLAGWAAAGACPPAPASGFMTADNPGGFTLTAYQPGPPTPFVSTTYNNTYNAATKVFWMHYGYQSGGNGQNTFQRQIYEKWVRQ